MHEDRVSRVHDMPPLSRLQELIAMAESVAEELYALPCSRTAAPEACRAEVGRVQQAGEPCGSGPEHTWCPACLAWWRQARVADYLIAFGRVLRALERSPRPIPTPRESADGIDLR
jgi:hypothetical protein